MKRLSTGELLYGHETYWRMRLSEANTSWAGVALVERRQDGDTVTSQAAEHLKLLDAAHPKTKLLVLAAGHGKDVLKGYKACRPIKVIMRLKYVTREKALLPISTRTASARVGYQVRLP